MSILMSDDRTSVPSSDWSISHSLMKPFIGGTAAREATPIRATTDRAGSAQAIPP